MDNPSNTVQSRINPAVVAAFTAMIIGSNFALWAFPDVKLFDTMVFVASFVFGLGTGVAVGALSETIWSFASPWGIAGAITPFLIAGELLFALAGWSASRTWGDRVRNLSPNSIFIGATMAICAFLWDFEANAATALLATWPSLTMQSLIVFELQGIPFGLSHELSDFLLGALLVPAVTTAIPRISKWEV